MLPYVQIVIPTYSCMAAIGFYITFKFMLLRNKKFEYSRSAIVGLAISAVLGLLVGSKLVFMISRIPYMIEHGFGVKFLLHELLHGGFVFYGGLLGALASTILYCNIRGLERNQALNYMLPGMVVFHAFGRIGCFLGGCCYGIEVSFGVPMGGVNRLPIQLIESFIEFVIAFYLLYLDDKAREEDRTCDLLPRYLLIYSTVRFILEFFRGDTERGIWGIFSTSQWISIVLLISVFVWWLAQRRNRKQTVTNE